MRMHPADVDPHFRKVNVGAARRDHLRAIIASTTPGWPNLLETHLEPYKKRGAPCNWFVSARAVNHLDQAVDWRKTAEMMSRNDGVAPEVGRRRVTKPGFAG